MFFRILFCACVLFIQSIKTSPSEKPKVLVKVVHHDAKDPCFHPPKVGPCKAHIPRYFFNETSKTCRRFEWGGCEKNGNNFWKLEDCEKTCSKHIETFKAGRVNETVDNDTRCQSIECPTALYGHYESLQCAPLRDAQSCCPTRYDCPMPYFPPNMTMDPKKCRFHGKLYDISEKINVTEIGGVAVGHCRPYCYCAGPHTHENPHKEAKVTCAKYECPELFGHPPGKEHCVPLYRKGDCCAYDYYCHPEQGADEFPDFPDSNVTPAICHVDGKEYFEGEMVHSKKSPCSNCLCVRANGTNSTGNHGELSCERRDCGYQVHFMEHLSVGCVPVFQEHDDGTIGCCPISWQCPHLKVKPAKEKKVKRNLAGSRYGSLIRKSRQDVAQELEPNGTAHEGPAQETNGASHEAPVHETNGTAPEVPAHEGPAAPEGPAHEANATAPEAPAHEGSAASEGPAHEANATAHEAPAHEAPETNATAHEGPAANEGPVHEANATAQEATETKGPAHEANATAHEAPVHEAPAHEGPAAPEAPAHEGSAAPEAPAHEAPAHEAPAHEAPAHEGPAPEPEPKGPAHEANGTAHGPASTAHGLDGIPPEIPDIAPIVPPANLARCKLPRETGPCRGAILSYYYHQASNKCEEYYYSGCFGNANRFGSREDCDSICRIPMESQDNSEVPPVDSTPSIEELTESLELSCMYGDEIIHLGSILPEHSYEGDTVPCGKPICRCITPPSLSCFEKACPENDREKAVAVLTQNGAEAEDSLLSKRHAFELYTL